MPGPPMSSRGRESGDGAMGGEALPDTVNVTKGDLEEEELAPAALPPCNAANSSAGRRCQRAQGNAATGGG